MALRPLISLNFRHKKRRPWTSLDDEVVEPGAFELACNVSVIIGLNLLLWLKAYTGAYMLMVAVPCQARKKTCDEGW